MSSTLARTAETRLWPAARLVAGREMRVKLRDKTFLFGTVFYLVFTLGSIVVPTLLGGGPDSVAVATRTDAGRAAADKLVDTGHEVRRVPDDAAAERLVRDGDVDAAVVGDGPDGVKVQAMREAPTDVVEALSVQPEVQLLDPDAIDPVLAALVPLAFALIFLLTTITFGVQIAQSITEEKQTRIVEILVAAVPVRALLVGKILANSLLALGQIVLTALVAVVGTQVAHATTLLTLIGPAIGWFVPFFVVGFVMLAALWAVAGALVSRIEDLASSAGPVQLLVMLPFFLVAFLSQNETALTVLSYVPFAAPTAMPVRLFLGQAQPWEPVLALVLLLATAVAFLLVGARLYEGSLLRTSGRTKLAVAWRHRAR
ncbi:ABC transporter permease [Micromonospora sp. NPDC049559]|uniref:ABC transporter permease n=1 Tax=Micromonospora sp. NPDC049559 TaxID=3155923 RepID=UPI0034221E90